MFVLHDGVPVNDFAKGFNLEYRIAHSGIKGQYLSINPEDSNQHEINLFLEIRALLIP